MSYLQGCRILDLGIITAGAGAGAILADLGADVIKVESPTYNDPFRKWSAAAPGEEAVSPFFKMTNRGKSGISIDLKSVEGRATFLRLVASSDVVVENFRRGVLKDMGLDFETLRVSNPNIILASISSHGETGPDKNQISFGTTLEAVGGLAWQTGYVDGGPVATGRDLNYPDQVVAVFAAAMVVTAWQAHRRGRSSGVHLDISQRELTSFLVGESFTHAGNSPAAAATGNARSPHVVQDCFQAADKGWVAVTVDEADLPALAVLVGTSPVASALTTQHLATWISALAAQDAVDRLVAAGVAAAPTLGGAAVFAQHAWSYALLRDTSNNLVKGSIFQADTVPLRSYSPAPQVGSHTAEILSRIGSFSDDEIAALLAKGVVEAGDFRPAAFETLR